MATRKGRPVAEAQTVLVGSKIPSGMVQPYTGTSAPAGFLVCDGSTVSRTTYSELFSVIGTSHGEGDGSTTFHLPDYRGRFLRGMDSGATRDPDAGSRTAPNTGGNTGDAIGSVQDDAMQGHGHNLRDSGSSEGGGGNRQAIGTPFPFTNSVAGINDRVRQPVSDGASGTPRTASESRPNNINVNYIIKV